MNRREFLKLSGAVMGSQLIAPNLFAASDAPAAIEISPGPQLFLDDYLIESQTNLQRVVTPPTRSPQPMITGKEDHNYQPYVTVVRDEASRKFRMWYGVPAKAGETSQSHLATIE